MRIRAFLKQNSGFTAVLVSQYNSTFRADYFHTHIVRGGLQDGTTNKTKTRAVE